MAIELRCDFEMICSMICSHKRVAFIDPGFGGTGLAIFNHIETRIPATEEKYMPPMPPIYTGVFKNKFVELDVAATAIADDVKFHVQRLKTTATVIEFPGLWSGSAVSQASASKGDLFILAFLVGAIANQLRAQSLFFITPQQWKGQMSKDLCIRRINKHFPVYSAKNHEADAVGMALSVQGWL